VSARRFGTKFRLATREVRQEILGAELDREEDSYTALDGGHEVMLCWGPVRSVTCIGVHVATQGCSLVVLEVQWNVRDRGSCDDVPEDCLL